MSVGDALGRGSVLVASGALALVIGLSAALPFGGSDERPIDEVGEWRVETRPFDVFLTEQIVFEADSVAAIASTLPSNLARVVFLAPEGSLVVPGEELARFDPTPFEDDLDQVRVELEEVHAQVERARTELEIKRTDLDGGLDEARGRLAVARLARKRLVEVEIPAQRRAVEENLASAQLELSTAEKTRDMTIELHDRGYASRDELDASEDEFVRARQLLVSRQAELELLENVEFPAALEEADIELAHLQQALARREADYPRQLRVANGSVTRYEARIRQLEATVQNITAHIEASRIAAPVAGIVSYPTLSFGEEHRKVQIGDTLWQRQSFLVLPDLDSLVAHAQVREVNVGGLAAGQSVRLVPHAFSELTLDGQVLSVGTVVEAETGSARRFEVRISTNNSDSRLRPGMTGRAEIHTHHYDDVPVVPLDAVHYLDGRPVAYVRDGRRWSARSLRLGGSDGALVAVEEGLGEGQVVALVRPSDAGT